MRVVCKEWVPRRQSGEAHLHGQVSPPGGSLLAAFPGNRRVCSIKHLANTRFLISSRTLLLIFPTHGKSSLADQSDGFHHAGVTRVGSLDSTKSKMKD